MNATDLKSLLYGYLATLRSSGGAERIGFELEYHIKHLDMLETRHYGLVSLRDLPAYRETTPRTLEEPVDIIKPFSHTEQFP